MTTGPRSGLFLIDIDDGQGFRPATTAEVDTALRQRELFGAADYPAANGSRAETRAQASVLAANRPVSMDAKRNRCPRDVRPVPRSRVPDARAGSPRGKSRSVSTGASPRHPSGWRSRPSTRCRTRTIPSPPERLAVAALDEMPDEDDPAAVRAWAPSAAFRDAVRSVVLATLALYLGIVESPADEADREDADDGGETMH